MTISILIFHFSIPCRQQEWLVGAVEEVINNSTTQRTSVSLIDRKADALMVSCLLMPMNTMYKHDGLAKGVKDAKKPEVGHQLQKFQQQTVGVNGKSMRTSRIC